MIFIVNQLATKGVYTIIMIILTIAVVLFATTVNVLLNRLSCWLTANLLKVNVSKSASMLIGSKRKYGNKLFNISLCGDPIPPVDNVKYLGIYIDRFLKWDIHITYLINKMKSRVYMLCRLKPLPSNILLRLYKVYIVPMVDYCSISYQSCSTSLSKRLDTMHFKAIRLLTSSKVVQTSIPSSPSARRSYLIAVQTYKILHNLAPSYLFSNVQYSEPISQRSLRNKFRVRVPPVNSNYGRNSFYFKCTKLWNRLSYTLYTCSTLKSFKSLYKIVFKL